MKACPQHQQSLALLAAAGLEVAELRALETHLANCPGCRNYLRELTEICREHSSVVENQPLAEVSNEFHQHLVRRIESSARGSANRSESLIQTLFAGWRWQIALPLGAAIVIFIVLTNLPRRRDEVASAPYAPVVRTVVNSAKADSTATLLAYRQAASKSPEALDALLAREVARSTHPTLRVTAFTRDLPALTE